MIKFVQSVKRDILEKNIYIWNVNTDSMDIFIYLGIMLVDIKGFALPPETNVGENKTIMNRPLITIDELNQKDNAVLITADYCVTIDEAINIINKPIFKYSEILTIDQNFYKKNVYIYGMGIGAKELTDCFNKRGINIKGYITSGVPICSAWNEKPAKKYDSKDFNEKDVIAVSVLNYETACEILVHCQSVSCDIYIKNQFGWFLQDAKPLFYFQKALKENKKLFLLSYHYNFGNQIIDFFKLFDLKFIHNNYSIDDLYYTTKEKIEDVIILINEFDNIKRVELLDQLKLIGFSIKNNNVIGMQPINDSKKYFLKKNDYVKDALCGHVQKYDSVNSRGWKILGNSNAYKPKIIILGGSTSSEELFEPETWMRKLYKKLNKLDLNCIFYIGGAADYKVIHELLRLLRDGRVIKPDIVISMSGVNDTEASNFQNMFNLIKNAPQEEYISGYPADENNYEYWLNVEKMLKLYVDSLNIRFFPFLQPMNYYVPNASIESKMMNESEKRLNGNKCFFLNANDKNIYTNLLNLFHNKPEMFIDNCHYSDSGAELLSDKVLETILPAVKEIYMSKYFQTKGNLCKS